MCKLLYVKAKAQLMIQLADAIAVGHISPGANLEKLLQTTNKEIVRIG